MREGARALIKRSAAVSTIELLLFNMPHGWLRRAMACQEGILGRDWRAGRRGPPACRNFVALCTLGAWDPDSQRSGGIPAKMY